MRDFIRTHPRLYDISIRLKRMCGKKSSSYDFLNRFSKELGHPVTFVQIGSNDGLRNDPVREFIVRDKWSGILIEPLPTAFEALKRNYSYLGRSNLIFVNAAVSNEGGFLDFWTYKKSFLDTQTLEQKMRYLRKSSFDPEHVRRFVPHGQLFEDVVEAIKVPCVSLASAVSKHGLQNQIDLLVIDAEGFEPVILRSIDFSVIKPKAIFFEHEHLDREKKDVYNFLNGQGYTMQEIRMDTVAVRKSRDKT
jgi:FkbM family methyltransferase